VLDAVVVKDKLRAVRRMERDNGASGSTHARIIEQFAFHTEIVINEIMYDHYPTQTLTGRSLFGAMDQLYNEAQCRGFDRMAD